MEFFFFFLLKSVRTSLGAAWRVNEVAAAAAAARIRDAAHVSGQKQI